MVPVHVEEPLVFIHPDLGHACSVDTMAVVGYVVWVERSEDMTNMTAGVDLHASSTPPHSE